MPYKQKDVESVYRAFQLAVVEVIKMTHDVAPGHTAMRSAFSGMREYVDLIAEGFERDFGHRTLKVQDE